MNNKTYFSPFMYESNLNLLKGPSIVFELDNLLGSAFVSSNYSKKKKDLGSSFYNLRFASYYEKTEKGPQGILKWPWPWSAIDQKIRLVEFFQIVPGFIALSPMI